MGTLIFASSQTLALVRQTRLQVALADVASDREPLVMLHNVYGLMIEHADLRAYLYEGVPAPFDGAERARFEVFAEMMADVLDNALSSGNAVSSSSRGAWLDYARHLLGQSPALLAVIDAHPTWWPSLATLQMDRPVVPRQL